jgi:hypothetical protein
MQKIIKLSDTHYIGVDDSEIKVGDIVAEKLLTGGYELFTIHTPNDIDKVRQKKVTHSTQPLEWFGGEIIFLSEVKELIGVVDVESRALKPAIKYIEIYTDANTFDFRKGYEKGYNEALEDNKEKKYTKEDMWAMFITGKQLGIAVSASIRNGSDKPNQEQYFNECIESRNPLTEWECIIDEQGKLKLI